MSSSPALDANQVETQNQQSSSGRRTYRHKYCIVTFDDEWPKKYWIFSNRECKKKENISGVMKCEIECADEDATGEFELKIWKASIIYTGNFKTALTALTQIFFLFSAREFYADQKCSRCLFSILSIF